MRLREDLILCYKILHGLIQIDSSQMFDYDSYYGPRSNGFILRAPKVRTDLGVHSFSYRTCNSWNRLSPNTVWAPTLKQFKTELYSEDLSRNISPSYQESSTTKSIHAIPNQAKISKTSAPTTQSNTAAKHEETNQ